MGVVTQSVQDDVSVLVKKLLWGSVGNQLQFGTVRQSPCCQSVEPLLADDGWVVCCLVDLVYHER